MFLTNRPHPNECSGSDLDGDLYFVSWDKHLIPPETDAPMDYTPAPEKQLDHPVTVEVVPIPFHYTMQLVLRCWFSHSKSFYITRDLPSSMSC